MVRAQSVVHVHTFVHDPDDVDRVDVLTVEDKVAGFMKASVTWPNVVARDPGFGMIDEKVHPRSEPTDLNPALRYPPMPLRVPTDLGEVLRRRATQPVSSHPLRRRPAPPRRAAP